MRVSSVERNRIFAKISEFEAEFRETPITARSPCGRVTVQSDHRGELLHIELSDSFTSDVDINKAEQLLINTMNAAINAPAMIRDRFYDGLSICGDSVKNWKKHQPESRTREAAALAFVDIVRTGMALREQLNKGTENVGS